MYTGSEYNGMWEWAAHAASRRVGAGRCTCAGDMGVRLSFGTRRVALCPTLEVRGAAPNTVAAQSLAPMCAHEHV